MKTPLHQPNRMLRNEQLLLLICAFLLIVVLSVAYLSVAGGTFIANCKELCVALVPNLIAAALTFMVVAFFVRRGIKVSFEDSAEEIARSLDEHMANREKGRLHPAIVGFSDSFRSIDWHDYLSHAQSELDIVVYYWDSWAAHHREDLVALFKRPGTRVRLFLPDPNNTQLMKEVQRLFPDSEEGTLQRKIVETARIVWSSAKEAGRSFDSLEVFFVPFPLNYALQRLDGRRVILSVFDMFRQNRVDSPVFEMDSSKSDHLRNYWHKEIDSLKRASTRVLLTDLDKALPSLGKSKQ